MTTIILLIPLALILGSGIGYILRKSLALKQKETLEAKVQKLITDAKTKEKEMLLGAKDKALLIIENAKKEGDKRQTELHKIESRLEHRQEILDSKLEEIDRGRQTLEKRAQEIRNIRMELQEVRKKQLETLEKVAGLSREKAKEVLLEMVEKDVKEDMLERIKKIEKETKETADRKAYEIIAQTIQRQAAPQTSETTTTSISLPSDEMKGRVIGREGRNIKRIEELCGVEIVVDDTPETIIISGFNPIRRYVAKKALEKLIADGRIHPGKIEEKVEEARQEITKDIKETGETVVYDLGITDFDPRLVQLLGRLKYRSSYGQNVLRHSLEVANLGAILAQELSADVNVVKRAGILHDIGKAVDHEIEGTHIEIGRNILKKFGISEDIIHAMECHHEDVKPKTVEAVIVDAADAISGARPGARRDTYENYIKRLQDLENIAQGFPGVEKTYAIQAGRELRIFVTPGKIDDLEATKLAKKIAEKIEETLKYPGEIKVNVIRETRVVEYAR
ncbi:MAG: ribonuclease Y [Patescibacteria group bacterium]